MASATMFMFVMTSSGRAAGAQERVTTQQPDTIEIISSTPKANITTVNVTAATAAQVLTHARNNLLQAFETANQALEWSKYAVSTANIASHATAVQTEENAKEALHAANAQMGSTVKLGGHDITSVQDATNTNPESYRNYLNGRADKYITLKAQRGMETRSSHEKQYQEIHHQQQREEEEEDDVHSNHYTSKAAGHRIKRQHTKMASSPSSKSSSKYSKTSKSESQSSSSSATTVPIVSSPLISLLEDLGAGMHEHVMKIQNTLDNAAAVVNTAVVEAKQTFAQAAATDTSVDSLEQAIRNAQQAAQQVVHQAQATGNSATQRINNQEYRRREHVREAAEKMTRTATDSP